MQITSVVTEIGSKERSSEEQLALHGGSPAVTVQARENWKTPKERIKEEIGRLIDKDIWSEAGDGLSGQFERRFAAYIGVTYCMAYDHGTSALWAAYYAVGLGPGDEILHPCYTWISSIGPALHLGARPVFCEIDPERLVIDPSDIEKRITPRTRAISLVHLYGNVCDMDSIMTIARRHNLYVIEDCSHCHGAEWDGKKLGSIGDIGCFSMQGNSSTGKPLPAGEGGVGVTNNRNLHERMLLFGQLNRAATATGFTDATFRKLAPTNLGLKLRSHPWALAAGMVMLDTLDYRNDRRTQYRQKIYAGFKDIPGVRPLKSYAKAKPGGYYGGMQCLYRPEELGGLPIKRFQEALEAEGVNLGYRDYDLHHLIPLFADGYDIMGRGEGPLTGDYKGYAKGSLPVSEKARQGVLGMPTFIEEEPNYSSQLIEAFKKVTSQYKTLL